MRFYARKVVRLLIVVFAVAALTFALVSLLPGDIVYAIAGQDAGSQPKQARHQELKAARRFHAAMVRLNADKVVTQDRHQRLPRWVDVDKERQLLGSDFFLCIQY